MIFLPTRLTNFGFLAKLIWRAVVCAIFLLPVFVARAVVLDWSGSYQVEINTLQNGNFEEWGSSQAFHNLYLQPEIKAFDGVYIKSRWHFAPHRQAEESFDSTVVQRFYPQEGMNWTEEGAFPTVVIVRDLYLKVAHDFGVFKIGWKPHHFGMGMYYNDSSQLFAPVYNKEGSDGFISWRGFVGSSYYIQPMIHYVEETLFNLFLQAGFTEKSYGVEVMYKTAPQGIEDVPVESPSYIGVYGYYKTGDMFSAQLEAGRTSDRAYGATLQMDWQTPVKWLSVSLSAGASLADGDKAFYFDPSFSDSFSFFISEYENIKSEKPDYWKSYSRYTFHSAMYVAPSVSFSILDSLTLTPILSAQVSYPDMDILLYHTELKVSYKLKEGLMWNTNLGAIFPGKEDNWYIGATSQAAITF